MSCNCNNSSSCNSCSNCPPPNKTNAIDCNPIPICNEIINVNCIEYSGVNLSCLPLLSQARLNQFLIALDSQICTLMNRFSVKPPCADLSGSITAVLTSDTTQTNPKLKASFYNMQDSTSYVCSELYCNTTNSITFTIPSIIVNGVEHIPYGMQPFKLTVTNANLKLVTANNNISVIERCDYDNYNQITGVIYTNFVDLFNIAFTALGLTNYKAQIAYNQSFITPEPDGFYIIFPETDTFAIKTTSDNQEDISVLNLKYTENHLTDWNNTALDYKSMYTDALPLKYNTIVEYDVSTCGVPIAK